MKNGKRIMNETIPPSLHSKEVPWKKKRETIKKRKGFMLLELIIVVAIIGILAAVAIPNLVGMTDEAKVAKIQSDLSTIGTAMEVYHVKKGGAYPPTSPLSQAITAI